MIRKTPTAPTTAADDIRDVLCFVCTAPMFLIEMSMIGDAQQKTMIMAFSHLQSKFIALSFELKHDF